MSTKATVRVKSFRRLGIVAGLISLAMMTSAAQTMPDGRPTPTGLEVPRWISLKSSKVRARQGPGLDYRILWEYRTAGLPVQVIAETREWRKICDPDGSVAWIHRTVASSRRSVFNRSDTPVAIFSNRSETSPVRATISPQSLVGLDECEEGWCRVRSGKVRGWIPERGIFGIQSHPLCNANRPAGLGRISD